MPQARKLFIYVESWGSGISKMTELCVVGGLPEPSYLVEGSDFWVIFKKDIYNTEYLESLGLNGRQVKAVLFAKEKGKITNRDYQTLNSISKRTATTELTELSGKFKILIKTGTSGSSISYKVVGQKLGSSLAIMVEVPQCLNYSSWTSHCCIPR